MMTATDNGFLIFLCIGHQTCIRNKHTHTKLERERERAQSRGGEDTRAYLQPEEMDSKSQTRENPETQTPSEDPNDLRILPFNSLSLSLSAATTTTLLPTPIFLAPPKITSLLFINPKRVTISPTHISSLSSVSLSSRTFSPPPKPSHKSTISSNPLQTPLSLNPRRPSDPTNPAGIRRSSIVWFRNDLRVHDNETLTAANNESGSVLPVYCFDPRDYGKSSTGFDKTGPYQATFLLESVSDLRKNLRERGSDLIVRIGKPETVLVELVKETGADAVYAHREVKREEVKSEEKIEAALKDEGVEVKYFWGSTLYHVDDLPFKLEEMPTSYSGFKEKVSGLEIRKTIEALDQLKGLPSMGDVEVGEIPSLVDLGLNPSATLGQDGKPAANASMVGGETEALQRLAKFADECQPNNGAKNGNNDSIYGANFSCKISPWLCMGCLSPRSMFDELKKSVSSRTISAASNQKDGGSGPSDTGMHWLMYELLWRDFFRFITKKCSTATQQSTTPVTAYAGATA